MGSPQSISRMVVGRISTYSTYGNVDHVIWQEHKIYTYMLKIYIYPSSCFLYLRDKTEPSISRMSPWDLPSRPARGARVWICPSCVILKVPLIIHVFYLKIFFFSKHLLSRNWLGGTHIGQKITQSTEFSRFVFLSRRSTESPPATIKVSIESLMAEDYLGSAVSMVA